MTRSIELLPIDPTLDIKHALVTELGSVVFEDKTYPNLVAFQNFLKQQPTKYMIIDPDESDQDSD